MSYVEIDPSDYHVLHPRPAYLIVSMDKNGRLNVMAASWVMPVSEEPPRHVVSVYREQKTYENIVETGEFTINIIGPEHAETAWKAGTLSGKKVDKWKLLGLQPLPSKKIKVPGIMGAYGVVECRVDKRIPIGECDLIICEPMRTIVRGDLYQRYGWDLRKAQILMHQRGRVFVTPGKLIILPKRKT